MTSEYIIESALKEWEYASKQTKKSVEEMSAERWDFTPNEKFGSFAKQVRHVICCRGVFIAGFKGDKINFKNKPHFYSGPLSRIELVDALEKSTIWVVDALKGLAGKDLTKYTVDYYGDPLTFIENFSALTSHEGLHRGQWLLYKALC